MHSGIALAGSKQKDRQTDTDTHTHTHTHTNTWQAALALGLLVAGDENFPSVRTVLTSLFETAKVKWTVYTFVDGHSPHTTPTYMREQEHTH